MPDTYEYETFFLPGRKPEGSSKHPLCINDAAGRNISAKLIETLIDSPSPAERLAVVEQLDGHLRKVTEISEETEKKIRALYGNSVNALAVFLEEDPRKLEALHGLLANTSDVFVHTAVEDTAKVSTRMGRFIINLFDMTRDLEHDGIRHEKFAVIRGLAEKFFYNYAPHYPNIRPIPTYRAYKWLLDLRDIDAKAFATPEMGKILRKVVDQLYARTHTEYTTRTTSFPGRPDVASSAQLAAAEAKR